MIANKLTLHVKKVKYILFSNIITNDDKHITINVKDIIKVKFLGIHLDSQMQGSKLALPARQMNLKS